MPFIELQTTDSTNNYALSRVHQGRLTDGQGFDDHGLVIFSHEQTAGKGQRGKKWASNPGSDIALSIVIRPDPLQPSQQFWLSACTAVSLRKFFSKYAGSDTTIKWPNDLYWKDRKAGGILIESILGRRPNESESLKASSKWEWAVIGLGINVNSTSFAPELPNPVSLKQITGRSFDTVQLAKELVAVFNDEFNKLMTSGFKKIYQQYISNLYKRNERVRLKKGTRVFEAKIKSVSTSGKLVIEHGMEEELDFGAVEWVMD